MHRFILRWLNASKARLLIALLVLHSLSVQAAVVLTSEEKAFIQAHPEIILGTDRSWEPFVIVDKAGHISGYDAEILDQINRLTGANFKLHAGSWNDVQQQAMSREIDGLSTGTAIEKRRAYLDFTPPYVILKKSVFVAKGNPANITSAADMQGKTVAIQQGNLADTEVMKQFPGTKVLFVDSVEALFTALSDGTADAIFGNGATFYLANKLGMPYLQIGFHLDQQLELVFGVRNDWPLALSILSKGLESLSEHQKIQIQTRWFSLPIPETANDSPPARLALTAEERGTLEQLSNLRLCSDPRWLPFTAINKDGELVGVTADLLTLIQQRLNLNWRVIPTQSWSETLKLAKTGECDLISSLQPTPEREVYLEFTQTLINTPLVLATRSDQFFIPDLRKVADKPIAMEKDSAAIRMIQNIFPDINIIEVDTVQNGLKLLSEEKVFGYIDSLEVIAHHVNQQRLLNIKISSTLPARYSLGLAVPKELSALVPILNKAIRNISTEEYNQIYNRWIAIKYESNSFDYRLLWTILSVIAVVLFFLVYRNRVVSAYNAKLKVLNEKLARQATTDQLTQLPNRYLLDREIQTALASAKRYKEPFSLVLFDLDFFKQINDKFGHQTGDKVLQEVSQVMDQHCRQIDILGRWGGEEFLLICPRTNLEGALNLANKIRAIVREHPFVDNNRITLSAGVAQFSNDESYSLFLKRLDDALYQAKHTGRDTVIVASGS